MKGTERFFGAQKVEAEEDDEEVVVEDSCPDGQVKPTYSDVACIVEGNAYTVESKDTFSNVATNNNLRVSQLKELNSLLEEIDLIFPGDVLVIKA